MSKQTINVKGCNDCPFIHFENTGGGIEGWCLAAKNNEPIETVDDNDGYVVVRKTPLWCPLMGKESVLEYVFNIE